MPRLRKSERRLLMLGGGLLLLFLVIFELQIYLKKRKETLNARHQLELRAIEVEGLIEQRDLWSERGEWLRKSQPPYPGEKEAHEAIMELAKSAESAGLESFNRQLLQPARRDGIYTQAGVTFQLRGASEDVFRWLYDIQSPEAFTALREFKINPDKEDPAKVTCTVELLKWYAPETKP